MSRVMDREGPLGEGDIPTSAEHEAPITMGAPAGSTINVPLPDFGPVVIGATAAVAQGRSADLAAPEGEASLADLTALFLNTSLLDVLVRLGARAVVTDAAGNISFRPNVRQAIATLIGADLGVPKQAAFVDAELAQALDACKRFIEVGATRLSFEQKVSVLQRDLENPPRPIP